jgi:ABC-2 type transport system ATP-binding protein
MHTALEAKALSKTYGGLFKRNEQALKSLTLSIPQGTAFGLIGPNGAGKTTFIKLLLGVVRPTSGEVKVLGGAPEEMRIRARIGYLPERMHLPGASNAGEFLKSVATLKSVKLTQAGCDQALQRVGLRNDKQRVGTFSKGMRQRLGLAAAMLGAPELLVLDEPTDGIDPLGRTEVRALLLEEKARGATILLNSHLLSETEKVCDRIGILQHGRLKLEGALDALKQMSRAWQVQFENVNGPHTLSEAGFVEAEGGFRFVGSVEALNEAIDRVRTEQVRVRALVPQTKSLEDVLSETLEPQVERGG